jgi:aminoglycoside phosphotransferase (APT) family kinase protein
MQTNGPVAMGGNRLTWAELPNEVRTRIEDVAGGRVVAARSQPGGFSPALASVLTLDTGAQVFAKAVSMTRNDFSATAIRDEVRVLGSLPDRVPAPRLRGSHDDGEWVAMVTDAVDGRNPAQPWRPDELRRFLDAATVLARMLTPSPIEAGKLADAAGFEVDGWREATEGTTLMHGDLRSDNFLLTATGFMVVDWPFVGLGPPWVDLLFSLPSIAMHGGGDPEEIWSNHPLGRAADPDAVTVVLQGLASFFETHSREPAPPLLPTIREFQRVQAEITRRWLDARRRIRLR